MRALALALLAAAATAAGPPARSPRVRAAVEAVQPSVVKIFGLRGFRGIYGYMTGIVVHESGLVLTRASVTLEEAPEISCHLHDGRRMRARIVREDRRSRMVLLRLMGPPEARYPVAPLGSGADVEPGRFVLLVGNAYRVAEGAERCAVNLGVVSAVEEVRLREGMRDFPYDRPVILHDAMNNPGVYGGPLVDLDGKVIGVSGTLVESAATNVQLHYAIPIDDLRAFIEDTLRRPEAPVLYDPVAASEPVRDAAPGRHGIRLLQGGINRATPAYVDRVVPNSPAARAGVRVDDLILAVDETEITTWKAFERAMERYRAGERVKLTVKRGDQILFFTFELEAEQ